MEEKSTDFLVDVVNSNAPMSMSRYCWLLPSLWSLHHIYSDPMKESATPDNGHSKGIVG